MRLGKTILVVVGATVLLAALVGSASAGRLSTSALAVNASWTSLRFRGGLGALDCEVIANGAFHERTISKVANTLSGFITAANVTRCRTGGATVLRETLPWHVQYESFIGTLPNIGAIRARLIGLSVRSSEPVFGIQCLSRSSSTQPFFVTFNRDTATGAIRSATASGVVRCIENELAGTLEGITSSITAFTVTLI